MFKRCSTHLLSVAVALALAYYYAKPMLSTLGNHIIESNSVTSQWRFALFEVSEKEFAAHPADEKLVGQLIELLAEQKRIQDFDTILIAEGGHYDPLIRRLLGTPKFQELFKRFDITETGLEVKPDRQIYLNRLAEKAGSLEGVRTYWPGNDVLPTIVAADVSEYTKSLVFTNKFLYQIFKNHGGVQAIDVGTPLSIRDLAPRLDDRNSFAFFEDRRQGKNAALFYGALHLCVLNKIPANISFRNLYGKRAVTIHIQSDKMKELEMAMSHYCTRPPDIIVNISQNRVYRPTVAQAQ